MKYLFLPALMLAVIAPPVACAAQKADSSRLPAVECRHIERELALTGKLDDPLWQRAKPVNLVDAATGAPAGVRTTARLLWSEKCLYLGFDCQDDYVWGTYTKRDENLYLEEVVEIFVCPTGKIRQYYEIEVSPLNTVLDTFVLNGKSSENRRWDNFHTFFEYNLDGLVTKVHVDGELNKPGAARGWSVEMAIPFAALIGNEKMLPSAGDHWRVNLFRTDIPEKGRGGQYAWSPILSPSDFHRPWRFGYLKFLRT